ncbi:hypothetical protein GCM10010522_39010 [Kribbella solani]
MVVEGYLGGGFVRQHGLPPLTRVGEQQKTICNRAVRHDEDWSVRRADIPRVYRPCKNGDAPTGLTATDGGEMWP